MDTQVQEADLRLDREVARLPLDVTTAIKWFMDENKITNSQLADLLGVSRGRVTQILSGDENLTLRTLASVAAALDAHFEVRLVGNEDAREAGRVLVDR